MVVVRLIGGLASQLHKYAVIKSICKKNKQTFKVDLSFFSKREFDANNIMHYGLPTLGITPEIASKEDVAKAKGYGLLGNLIFRFLTTSILNKYTNGFFERAFYKLESYSFYRSLTSKSYMIVHVSKSIDSDWRENVAKSDNCYIYGEFGIGFDDIDSIRAELSNSIVNAKVSSSAELYRQLILNEQSPVAVHVRRGDYVSNKSANQFHGVCSIEYYRKSINLVKEIEGSRLFLFSDDLNWVREHFSDFITENSVFVSGNDGFEDFILMTSCKYHIIANSGFSSMASWLSMSPDKYVYSPERWFLDDETNKNQKALLPKDWNYV